jgi:hypothetical protein
VARHRARPVIATDATIPEKKEEAAWGHPTHGEPRYQAAIAVILAVALYVTLPEKLTFGEPRWTFPALEAVLLVPLWLSSPYRKPGEAHWQRLIALALIAVINVAYVSFTNATAFSSTDTMPLTEWAKLLMMIQSLASLITVALVAARAVNVLH